jgi:hypothetical protein
MSLINEALKKAQRQRSLDAAPLSSAPSGVAAAAVTTHVATASHRRSLAPLWFGLGVLALGIGATVLVMRYGIEDEPAKLVSASASPSTPAPVAAPKPTPDAPTSPATPAVLAPKPEAPSPLIVLPSLSSPPPPPALPAPTPAPAPAAPAAPVVTLPYSAPTATPQPSPAPASAPVTAPAPAPVVAVAPVAALPASPAEREAQAYAFISSLRITGVRGTEREARVLMNERVWRLNDVVSPELGLRISSVRPNLLVFTDAQGKSYEKPY